MKTIITTIAALLLTATTFAQKVGPLIGAVSLTQPTCYGESNGEITMTPSGGLAPYTYLWSTGDTTQTISNLASGNYSVLVNDAMGNTMGGFFTVPQPAQITISGSITNTPIGQTTGSIDILSVDNAVGQYDFTWTSNNGQTMDQSQLDQSNLKPGGYKIIVTDENGCQGFGYFQVNATISPINNPNFKTKPFINNTTSISTYPNPSNGNFTIETKGMVNAVRVVNSNTGEEVFVGGQFEDKMQVNDLPTGIYMIYLETQKGTQIERVSVL